ncbi:MAG TPA: hypothetical protein VKV18_05670 [Chthonomonas sp.]|uniref:hypothetical protein n=1 Tax=Chthonomonas sp. TaxID=2282153 RepID=UPI002B4B4A8A|nr:hypothetical protein [Chthonomonas sp.]HLI48165.1 hypothetical protein [Chthonomonas sp.]
MKSIGAVVTINALLAMLVPFAVAQPRETHKMEVRPRKAPQVQATKAVRQTGSHCPPTCPPCCPPCPECP